MPINLHTSTILLVNNIISEAIHVNASDIHFEPQLNHFRIRQRIDGLLQETQQLPIHLMLPITTRLKVLADLDIAERRLPQDGHFQFHTTDSVRDCRINTCPTLYGEKSVLRLLYHKQHQLSIDQLGFTSEQSHLFQAHLNQPQGLILVTGPTGSGKTITLYTALDYLNKISQNICSVEDPIEMQIAGVNQVQVNRKANLDFSTALRAFLRQDPDIIMIGEIRDLETANMAIRAAQTGHLVLSTLHTNSAVESLTRLNNIGIAPYNISSALTLVIAQRLVRRITPEGYQGRAGIFELLHISENIRHIIPNDCNSGNILTQAKKEGMKTLQEIAEKKIAEGITDQKEVDRVIQRISMAGN